MQKHLAVDVQKLIFWHHIIGGGQNVQFSTKHNYFFILFTFRRQLEHFYTFHSAGHQTRSRLFLVNAL